MQKTMNILFILIILAVASITPLNRALSEINIFAPIVETPSEPPKVIEHIYFTGIEGFKLAGGESGIPACSPDYWTDVNPDTHLLGFIKANEDFAIKFLYTSTTGDFNVTLPELKLNINTEENFTVSPLKEEIIATNLTAEYVLDKKNFEDKLKPGYNRVRLMQGGVSLGYFVIAKDTAILGKFMNYEEELPENSKVIKFYIPDSSDKNLIPVSRIYPSFFYDYIQLFEALYKGAKNGYGLKGMPSVVHTNSYWISNREVRVDYRSDAIQTTSNPELMYRAIGYTFAQLGDLKKTNVFIDGVLTSDYETPVPPYHYNYVEGENGYLLITEEPSDSGAPSAHIAEFINKMFEKQLLPPHCKLINCEKKDNVLHIEISHYEDMENAEIFEPLLNLSAYSLDGVEELRLNGRLLAKIKAFNME